MGDVLFILAATLVALANVPLALSLAPTPAPTTKARVRLPMLWATAPVAFVGALVSGFVTGASGAMGAVFARSVGLDVLHVSIYTSAVIAGGAAMQYPLGRMADRVDRRLVLGTLFAAVAAISLLAMPITVQQPQALPLLGFCWGAAAHCIYASALAHANDRAPQGEIVGIGSGILVLWGAGAVVGPMGASALMHAFGPVGYFVWPCGAGGLALLFVFAHRLRGGRVVAGGASGANEHLARSERA